jgi:alkylation response protein AidB-like acyl-CoA dehydrogenase
MCGGAQRVLDMTTAYAKIRIAFGKPIGSYQGVKHRAADMLVDIENAKSLTYYAVWAIDEGVAEGPLAAGPTGRMPTAKWPAPASNYTAASALPRSTTCSSISSAPRPPRSPSATPLGTASASLG